MPAAFVQSGVGTASNTSSPSVTLGVAPTAGNILVAHVAHRGTKIQTLTTASGYALISSVAQGAGSSAISALLWKIAAAGEPAAQGPALLNLAEPWICSIAEYSGTTTLENNSATSQNTSIKTSPSISPTSGVQKLLIGAAFNVGAEVLGTSHKFAGSTAEVTVRTNQLATGAAPVFAATLWDRITTSTGAYTAAVEFAAVAADTGAAHIAAFSVPAGVTLFPMRTMVGWGI